MNSRVYQAIALAVIIALPSIAQDGASLEPVDGYLSSPGYLHSYMVAVREILVRGATDSPAVMVTLPSFKPESMVYLRVTDAKVFVVSAAATKQIWSTEKKAEIEVIQTERQISVDIAEQIGSAFALAVTQAHYPKTADGGADGVRYHFSAFVGGTGVRAGQTWSPYPQTTCGRLVTLGEHLHAYVRGELPAEKVKSEVLEVLAILQKNA